MSDYTEDELRMYSAWSDYRSEYGASGETAFKQFIAGWAAARDGGGARVISVELAKHSYDWRAGWDAYRGTLDIGGVMR